MHIGEIAPSLLKEEHGSVVGTAAAARRALEGILASAHWARRVDVVALRVLAPRLEYWKHVTEQVDRSRADDRRQGMADTQPHEILSLQPAAHAEHLDDQILGYA